MPTFKEEALETITLPSSADDPVIVTVDATITGGTAEDIYGDGVGNAPISKLLTSAIREWNVTDKDGSPLPITQDNVRRMDPKDFSFLGEKLFGSLNVAIEAKAVSSAEKKG